MGGASGGVGTGRGRRRGPYSKRLAASPKLPKAEREFAEAKWLPSGGRGGGKKPVPDRQETENADQIGKLAANT